MTTPATFRLGLAEGIVPRKWVRAWEGRFPEIELQIVPLPASGGGDPVRAGEVDAAILRLPLEGSEGELHVIPLFEETPVIVTPKDHYLCAASEVTTSDFTGELLQQPIDGVTWLNLASSPPLNPPANAAAAIQLVAAGVGLVVVPMSIARLHHRKDLTYRPVTDLALTGVGLVWQVQSENPLVEEFIGIVRGRSAESHRGKDPETAPKRTAQEKARARREYLKARRGPGKGHVGSGRERRRGPGKRR